MSNKDAYSIYEQPSYPENTTDTTENLDSTETLDPTQEAFNAETGEINWDCPCLGGMANGTCGEEFKAAFSCFVYSTEEQKGIDCVEKFQAMQDCFRAHPEEYGPELVDDDDDDIISENLKENTETLQQSEAVNLTEKVTKE
ncbi:hypothetical protein BB561_000560 [Smittium simulii]|uniref:Mitochondrial intermembrane space import and assembly protein 40 n=1 Tax=Smittium simulii TaxID=133385 RepID=A0A2T9YYS0_9FUNG|nr:hypothetical protein BB561_000560 [Smittium simulii]